jgi:hypothetical protein
MESPKEWIDSAIAACARGREMRELGHDVWVRELNELEGAILEAASIADEIKLRCAPGLEYPLLMAGDRPIFAPSAPYWMSLHWDAFQTLCVRGVVRPREDGDFELDLPALDKARRLRVRTMH